ncbi:Ig-like domain-containing protein [Polaribacter sp.]|uniref:Ig-like domain-containing protein n=1 Tax=Polaribacter sp. TaxID=1920175 RepID=UPI003EF5C85A
MKKRYILLLIVVFTATVTYGQTLISSNSTWKYLDNGSNQNTVWTAINFNDNAWNSGPAELGYGDGGEATIVSYGNDSNNKYITTYFRKSFNVTNPGSISGLDLDILVDDGAVVYLNGVELLRQNMPTGTINYQTLAPTFVSGSDEQAYTNYSGLSSATLVSGTNVIAVEVHQQSGSSSDIGFDMSLSVGGPPGQPNVIRGPYLQIGTSTSTVVKWRTNNPSNSKVFYGTSLGNLTQSAFNGSSTSEHEVTVTGLLPNTKYYYAVGTSVAALEGGTADYTFTSSPTPGTNQPIRAWILGDSGTANSNAAAVKNAYKNYVNTNSLHTDMMLMLGDNAYNSGTDSEYQAAVFNMYPTMLQKSVLWSCPGNHDYGTINSYLNIFTQPTNGEAGGIGSGTERYYSFDYGNIHFISLDSHGSPRNVGGAQYNWLQNDLNNTTADWIVAFWHHPPYTNGSHNSDSESYLVQMRENFLPLLELHGVDLVLSGHSHSYERTYLLKGHYGKSNTLTGSMILDNGDGDPLGDGAYDKGTSGDGAVYITAGSSGKISGVSSFPMMYTWQNQLGSVVMETQNNEMRVRFLRSNGSFSDDFTLTKDISNSPPIAQNDAVSPFQGESVDINLVANDSDPNGNLDYNTISIITPPTKGTLGAINTNNGTISYTPFTNATGSDSFIYEICDDGVPNPVLCDQATVNINIQVNTAPNTVTDNATTNENTNILIDVLDNDTDAENNIDITSVQITIPPTNGSILSISASGEIEYQPNNNYSGTDNFSYTVSDDLNATSGNTVVNISILSNVPPVANDDTAITTEDTSVIISIFNNDTDPNNDLDTNNASTAAGLLQPLHGVVNFLPGIGFEYVPNTGFNGYDQFEYSVCDQSNPTPLCNAATVTVFVDCSNNQSQNIIKGTVYEDANEDMIFNHESGQNNVIVQLFNDDNGNQIIDGSDAVIDSKTTDVNGNYSFIVNPVFTTSNSLSKTVSNDIDDAWQKDNGDVENDKDNHEMGEDDTWIGLRFRNVNIPANANITDARLVFKSAANEDKSTAAVKIYGELDATPAVYNETDYGISSRSKGTSVPWTMGNWIKNQQYTSPNIASAIQDVINLNGWSAGNNLALILEGTGSKKRKFYSHDGNNPVKLEIDYGIPGLANYSYILEIDESSLPPSGNLTTDSFQYANMTALGQLDCHNNFGFSVGPPNISPTISLTSPGSATYNLPQSFTMQASASDVDGTISQVEFFINGNSVGVGVEAPSGVFTSSTQNLDLNGTYLLTAKATDNSNGVTTSNQQTIIINIPNNPPTVSITNPLNGTSFTTAQTITITANAQDFDTGLGGTISQVDFYANGNLIGSDSSIPYEANLNLTQDANINITAIATDGLGETATSTTVNIVVNLPNVNPTISITSPAINTSYTSPQNVGIVVDANDSDGAIAQVDFYIDGVFLSTDASYPYETSYLLDTDGSFNITAIALDNEGGTATSSNVTITLLSAPTTVSYQIINSDDDAWEKGNGDMKLTENDHALSKEGFIGLRYQNVQVPENATITEAYIEFIASRKEKKNTSRVNVYGELSNNANPYNSVDYNISNRTSTSSSVSWTFANWFEDVTYTSPDLTTIVQEIIDQGGWTSGSAMAFMFDATANEKRKAYTFDEDEDPTLTPKLFISYQGGTPSVASRSSNNSVNNSVENTTKESLEIIEGMSDLRLFPNPTFGLLNITFNVNRKQSAEMYIYSMDGKKIMHRIMQTKSGLNSLAVQLSRFSKGNYIVIVKSGNNHISKTVVLN